MHRIFVTSVGMFIYTMLLLENLVHPSIQKSLHVENGSYLL